jgi:single-stranded-DNA-specific exonuclease
MFYVLLALRAELRRRGAWQGRTEPQLAELLDLVALGTVADVVRLDRNNRLLVAAGLKRLRSGRARPGLLALLRLAGREPRAAGSLDLGFAVGPRINAAGRLSDISLGVECLLADGDTEAARLAGFGSVVETAGGDSGVLDALAVFAARQASAAGTGTSHAAGVRGEAR